MLIIYWPTWTTGHTPAGNSERVTGRVEFATGTAPRPPFAELVSNPTPPGQLARESASWILRAAWPRFLQPGTATIQFPCWPPRKRVANWLLQWKLIETMSAKDILLEVAEKLPPEATLNDAIYELEFRQAVQQGLDELDRGEGIPIEQVKAKIAEWAGK
jgi:hypothetical protein